jgi:hypothetical protein
VKLEDEIVIEDTAATTITLLDSTLFITKGGKRYTVKNTSAGNISLTSPNLIDGIVTQTLTPNQSITVISDSTDWIII